MNKLCLCDRMYVCEMHRPKPMVFIVMELSRFEGDGQVISTHKTYNGAKAGAIKYAECENDHKANIISLYGIPFGLEDEPSDDSNLDVDDIYEEITDNLATGWHLKSGYATIEIKEFILEE